MQMGFPCDAERLLISPSERESAHLAPPQEAATISIYDLFKASDSSCERRRRKDRLVSVAGIFEHTKVHSPAQMYIHQFSQFDSLKIGHSFGNHICKYPNSRFLSPSLRPWIQHREAAWYFRLCVIASRASGHVRIFNYPQAHTNSRSRNFTWRQIENVQV